MVLKAGYGSPASNKKQIIISATKIPRKVKAKLILVTSELFIIDYLYFA